MTIGEKIKELRESKKLTQSELGEIIGVTDKAISTWEKGKAYPRIEPLEKMADYFGVKKSYLIEDQEEENHIISNRIQEIISAITEKPDIISLILSAQNVSNEDLKYLIALAKRLGKNE